MLGHWVLHGVALLAIVAMYKRPGRVRPEKPRTAKIPFTWGKTQRLESVGRLASGVAHEINTPIQFVRDSLDFVCDTFTEVAQAVDPARVKELDLDYALEQTPQALERAKEGLERVAAIVRSMKAFARPDAGDMTATDLNAAIESTLTIARNEYKYVADVDMQLATLPRVVCHPGEINQVMLNIVVNAAHAIREVVGESGMRGTITVCTAQRGEDVIVRIGDTGCGIPESIRDRIFDPFFTTKEVGQGTGQGLAIARSVVVDKHRGSLTFESEVGRGTTFEVRLPIRAAA